jgi:hypothetical protein
MPAHSPKEEAVSRSTWILRLSPALSLLLLLAAAPAGAATPADSLAAADSVVEEKVSPPHVLGYIQVRETLRRKVATTTLNRVRLGVDGKLPHRFSYKMQIEAQSVVSGSNTAAVTLREAWVRWSPAPFALTAGELETPYSREWAMSSSELETPDRSIVSEALAPRVEIGVMGAWTPVKPLTVMAGAFNGEGQNAVANRDSTTLLFARIAAEPVDGLTFAAATTVAGGDSVRYTFGAGIERGPVALFGEFLAQKHTGVDSRDEGWYGLLLVRTLPWLRLVARQEELHRPQVEGERARERGTTLGILADVPPGGRVRGLVDYVRRTVGFDDSVSEAVIAQLQVKFF